MKKINNFGKFKTFYYIGLSVILTIAFFILLTLSAISGLVAGYFSHKAQDIEETQKIENVEPVPQKVILYDTVKVEIYDTVRVVPKKVKPVIIKEENTDSLK